MRPISRRSGRSQPTSCQSVTTCRYQPTTTANPAYWSRKPTIAAPLLPAATGAASTITGFRAPSRAAANSTAPKTTRRTSVSCWPRWLQLVDDCAPIIPAIRRSACYAHRFTSGPVIRLCTSACRRRRRLPRSRHRRAARGRPSCPTRRPAG